MTCGGDAFVAPTPEAFLELTPDLLALGTVWYLVFVFSTTCHEAAHAWAALKLGDPTAYHGGQVSLSPIPHLKREPFGMLLMPLLSFFGSDGRSLFGWASAPFDPTWALNYPKRSAVMAAAGPAANLVLAIGSALGMAWGISAGIFELRLDLYSHIVSAPQAGLMDGFAALLSVGFALNVLLFVFNLFPVPPLDGSTIIQLAMSDDTARRYRTFLWEQPMITMAALLIAFFFLGPLAGRVLYMATVLFAVLVR